MKNQTLIAVLLSLCLIICGCQIGKTETPSIGGNSSAAEIETSEEVSSNVSSLTLSDVLSLNASKLNSQTNAPITDELLQKEKDTFKGRLRL